MKQCVLILFGICSISHAYSQVQIKGKEFYHYVFPDFTEGAVKKRSGEIVKTLLNYNTITEEMIFQQAGTFRALDNAERIDTVYVGNKKFVPAGKVFYEVATYTPVALFIRHRAEIISPGSNIGFGATQTSAISNLNSLIRTGGAYQLTLPDDFKLTSQPEYLLKKNGNYHYINVNNFKQVETVFPEKGALIKDFVKANKLSFTKPEDVVKLILYCN